MWREVLILQVWFKKLEANFRALFKQSKTNNHWWLPGLLQLLLKWRTWESFYHFDSEICSIQDWNEIQTLSRIMYFDQPRASLRASISSSIVDPEVLFQRDCIELGNSKSKTFKSGQSAGLSSRVVFLLPVIQASLISRSSKPRCTVALYCCKNTYWEWWHGNFSKIFRITGAINSSLYVSLLTEDFWFPTI